MPLGFGPIGASSMGASAQGDTPTYAPSISITVVDRNGLPVPNGTTVQGAWFDQDQPQNFTAPVWKGTLTVEGDEGIINHQLVNSVLSPGSVGWLIITNSDGVPTTRHRAFGGPVAVI